MSYTLLGMEHSLYSGKARAYMRWKGIDFEERLATRDVYTNEILPRVGWPVVPVVFSPDDETLQDTSDIIDYIEAREGGVSVFPATPKQRLAALLFELFGDEWMVIPAMHYRWNLPDQIDWIYQTFGAAIQPELSPEEHLEIGKKVGSRFKGSVPFLGITEDTIPEIEAWYEEFLGQLSAHLEHHPYLFGTRPSIGDYGLIGPMYAHLLHDRDAGKIMRKLAPKAAEWTMRVEEPDQPQSGAFLPDDEVPQTLYPILSRQMIDQFAVLRDDAQSLTDWAKDQDPGTEVPRALGMHEFTIGKAKGQRAILPFSLWMLQRPLDFYRGLTGDDKVAADEFLDAIGGEIFRSFPDYPRLERKNFKLVLAG